MHKPAQILLAFFLSSSLFSFVPTRFHPAMHHITHHHRGRKPRLRAYSIRGQRLAPRGRKMDVHGARLISIINSTGSSPFLFFNRNVSSLLERWCIFNFSSATLIIVNARAARFDWRSGEQENKEGGLSDRRRQISSGCGAKSRQTVVPTILSTLLSIRPSNSSRPRFDSLIIGNRSPTAR